MIEIGIPDPAKAAILKGSIAKYQQVLKEIKIGRQITLAGQSGDGCKGYQITFTINADDESSLKQLINERIVNSQMDLIQVGG